ncbi:MAG TPA: trypsin-like peptidase domain-containing protein [Jiangellaceae bacterium]|nr:trypsin-like peptidase domain-containing protein [Jiangellaceae bacterium]
MDQSTRSSDIHGQGPGWTAPSGTGGGELPRRDPWTTRPDESGQAPRPNETRVLHSSGSGTVQVAPPDHGTVPPGRSSAPPMDGPAGAEHATSRPARRGIATLALLALGAGLVGGAAGSAIYDALTDEPAPAVSSLEQEPRPGEATGFASVEQVADQVLPSVVSILAGPGGGSGVIISSDGEILTNNHVAEAARAGQLQVTFTDGSTAPAEIVGLDPVTDIAVIQAQGVSDLQPAELGDSAELRVGEQVVAIGSPLGLEGTVTSGIVSALNRPVTAGGRMGGQPATFGAIQTDAPINPGNSGGPLVNMSGQVVGINTAIATMPGTEGSVGLGFSIPMNQARVIAEQLVESGTATHARLEIGVNDVRGDTTGALVADVVPGGAADTAGLQQGDVITQIEDLAVNDAESLIAAVRAFRPGDDVSLTVVRNGESLTVDVTLGSSTPST